MALATLLKARLTPWRAASSRQSKASPNGSLASPGLAAGLVARPAVGGQRRQAGQACRRRRPGSRRPYFSATARTMATRLPFIDTGLSITAAACDQSESLRPFQ